LKDSSECPDRYRLKAAIKVSMKAVNTFVVKNPVIEPEASNNTTVESAIAHAHSSHKQSGTTGDLMTSSSASQTRLYRFKKNSDRLAGSPETSNRCEQAGSRISSNFSA